MPVSGLVVSFSDQPDLREKAMDAIAAEVYGPIPGKDSNSILLSGITPLYSSIILIAAFFRFLALL